MAAYAFARLEFRGKRLWFAIMLGSIMLPIHVIIVPQYILFARAGLDQHVPAADRAEAPGHGRVLHLPDGPVHPRASPGSWTRPRGIDGCGHGRIYLRIMLPLSLPALATTAIFTFIWTWNDFFSQLIFLTDPDMYTVPVALRRSSTRRAQSSWGPMFAMSIVSLVPVFLVFLFGQKYLVKGIATTGIK